MAGRPDTVVAEAWIALAFLAAFSAQTVFSSLEQSATHDEPMHLTAGYTYLKTGDFRLNPQHPPLAKLLAGLPLMALDPAIDFHDTGWTSQPPEERGFARRFLFSNDADRLLFWGRLPLALLSVVLGIYIWRWARARFGPAAGLGALLLFAFCPNFVAHAHLVTFDVPLATFFVMTLFHAWRWMRTRSRFQLVATGLCLGLALGTKFSAIVLLPTLALLFWVPARSEGPRAGRTAWATAVVMGLAFVVVQAIYFFPSDPLIYFKNATRVYADKNPLFEYYLLGEFRKEGWWYYFLAAMLFKTPLPVLFLVGVSVISWRIDRSGEWPDDVFLVRPSSCSAP